MLGEPFNGRGQGNLITHRNLTRSRPKGLFTKAAALETCETQHNRWPFMAQGGCGASRASKSRGVKDKATVSLRNAVDIDAATTCDAR